MNKIEFSADVKKKYIFTGQGVRFSHRGNTVIINGNMTLAQIDELYNSGFGHFELTEEAKAEIEKAKKEAEELAKKEAEEKAKKEAEDKAAEEKRLKEEAKAKKAEEK